MGLQTPPPVAPASSSTEAPVVADPNAPAAPEAAKAEAPKEEPRHSKAFAEIARQQKALQKQRDEIAAKERALAEKYKPYQEEDQLWGEKKALDVLKRRGLSFNDLAQMVLNDGKVTPEMQVKSVQDEVQALKDELKRRDDEVKKQAEEARQKADSQAIVDFKNEIKSTLDANPDEFELTRAIPHGVELVYNKIDDHLQKTAAEGQAVLLSHEDAARLVEKDLEAEAERLVGLKKLQSKFKPPEPAAPATPDRRSPEPPRTLSNALATSAPTPTQSKPRNLDESIEEAAKLLRFM